MRLAAELVAQSIARVDDDTTTFAPDATIEGFVELRNIGSDAWDPDTLLCTTGPRLHASLLSDSSWVREGCLARIGVAVAAGDTVRVQVRLRAPHDEGDFLDHFSLAVGAAADLRWFADDGGCDDSLLGVKVRVRATVTGSTGSGDGSCPSGCGGDPGSGSDPGSGGDTGSGGTASEGTVSGEIVTQSFVRADLGAVALDLGASLDASVDIRNTGTLTWDHGTRLCTTLPRLHASTLSGDGWSDDHCTEGLLDSVAPGAIGHFRIRLHAGLTIRDVTEHLTLVHVRADGSLRWFADEGGCADDLVAIHVDVNARLRASIVGESFPCDGSDVVGMLTGALFDGYVDIRNDGSETWDSGLRLCTVGPRLHDSLLACVDWVTPSCMEGPATPVLPGAVARFRVHARAPLSIGEHDEHFGLAQLRADGTLRWFSDEGACAEDLVRLRLHVGLL